jgi:hypothetical protein
MLSRGESHESVRVTSELRSYLIIGASTIAAVCAFVQGVEHWDARSICGLIAVAATALVNGFSKSPRDAKITDQAENEVAANR